MAANVPQSMPLDIASPCEGAAVSSSAAGFCAKHAAGNNTAIHNTNRQLYGPLMPYFFSTFPVVALTMATKPAFLSPHITYQTGVGKL